MKTKIMATLLVVAFLVSLVFAGMTTVNASSNYLPTVTPTPTEVPPCVDLKYYTGLYLIYSWQTQKDNIDSFYMFIDATFWVLDAPACMDYQLRDNIRIYVVHKYMYEYIKITGIVTNGSPDENKEPLGYLRDTLDILSQGGNGYDGMWYEFCKAYSEYCSEDGFPLNPLGLAEVKNGKLEASPTPAPF